MVIQHPANFGGHRHCDSGEVMLVEDEEQDSTCSGLA